MVDSRATAAAERGASSSSAISQKNLARTKRADNGFVISLADGDVDRSGLDQKRRCRTVAGTKYPVTLMVVLAI